MPLLASLTLAAVISIFIIPVLLIRRDGHHRAQDYFVSSDHVLPKVIQNSSIAYAIGLATFGPFFAWGVRGDFWPAIVHAAFFGSGLILLYALRRPMLKFLARALSHDRSVTVHGFIARRHGNDPRIRGVAAALTVFGLSGLVICETLGLATVRAQAAAFRQREPHPSVHSRGFGGGDIVHNFVGACGNHACSPAATGCVIFWTIRIADVPIVSANVGSRVGAGTGHVCHRTYHRCLRRNVFLPACAIRG